MSRVSLGSPRGLRGVTGHTPYVGQKTSKIHAANRQKKRNESKNQLRTRVVHWGRTGEGGEKKGGVSKDGPIKNKRNREEVE